MKSSDDGAPELDLEAEKSDCFLCQKLLRDGADIRYISHGDYFRRAPKLLTEEEKSAVQ